MAKRVDKREAERKRDKRKDAKPPRERGIKGRDSIDLQPGLREFLDSLHNERVEYDLETTDGEVTTTTKLRRRLTLDEIKDRVRLSGFRLSRTKIGEDRLEQEIFLSEQRRIVATARAFVEQGGDDILLLQSATNQRATAALLDAIIARPALSEDDGWLIDGIEKMAGAAARLESVRNMIGRQLKRAKSEIYSLLETRLKNEDRELRDGVLELLDHVVEKRLKELR